MGMPLGMPLGRPLGVPKCTPLGMPMGSNNNRICLSNKIATESQLALAIFVICRVVTGRWPSWARIYKWLWFWC